MHFSALSQICWPCLVAILNIRRLKFRKSSSSGQACSLSAPKALLKKFSQASIKIIYQAMKLFYFVFLIASG